MRGESGVLSSSLSYACLLSRSLWCLSTGESGLSSTVLKRAFSSSSASFRRRSVMVSYHACMVGSGVGGKHERGSILGNVSSVPGILMSHLLTACLRKSACSSGASKSCIVDQTIHPSALRAGMTGSEYLGSAREMG